ncbi:hypothetical protein [Nostocoides sp. Soil756]|uniref:hypothetical protein n=1 Tax=Nostocoides sp. Soil756 TaxID=1736399 RepID=UPI0006F66E4B|nr:hypothetical protein [Tetrasphaera sp. Soil756]KRE63577.1 hypothetical protein ASG78_01385 [Tetrasphaera sp. Soil756]
MNHPHDDSDPLEHDPTGMRALLAGLPDPEPMPPSLIARIEAALADEARLAAGWAAPECPPELRADEEAHRATVLPLPPHGRAGAAGAARGSSTAGGRRRTRLRLVGAAAAVVAVLGAGGLVLQGTEPGGLLSALGGADSDSSAAGAAEGGSGSPDLRAAATLVRGSDALGVQVIGGGLVLDSTDLRSVATGLPSTVSTAPAGPSGPAAAPQGDTGTDLPAIATAAAGRACATVLGIPRGDQVLFAPATVDGRAALVVLATTPSGARTAWAVGPGCSPADAQVIAGPVPAG